MNHIKQIMTEGRKFDSWTFTGKIAVWWWFAFALTAISGNVDVAIALFFTAAGWTGWGIEERKNIKKRTPRKRKKSDVVV